jgi:hypothetical protein
MGKSFADKYSYLHFVTGSLVYYWGISLSLWIVLHTLFEIFENTSWGVHIIDTYITLWPGGKKSTDSFINIVGDTVFTILGWLLSHYISNMN